MEFGRAGLHNKQWHVGVKGLSHSEYEVNEDSHASVKASISHK